MIVDTTSTKHRRMGNNPVVDPLSVSLHPIIVLWFLIARHSLLLSLGRNRLHIRRQHPQHQVLHQETDSPSNYRCRQSMVYICTRSAKGSKVCLANARTGLAAKCKQGLGRSILCFLCFPHETLYKRSLMARYHGGGGAFALQREFLPLRALPPAMAVYRRRSVLLGKLLSIRPQQSARRHEAVT